MSILDIGAGGAEGLEKLLARMLAEERMGETKRSNMAGEKLQGQQIDETSKLRMATIEGMTENQRRQDQDRDQSRLVGQAIRRPIGSAVTRPEMDKEVAAGIPYSLYKDNPPQLPSTTFLPNQKVEQNPEKPGVINFVGTEQQQETEERRKLLEAERGRINADRDASRGIRGHAEDRLTEWGPPTISIGDSSVPGGARIIRRPDLPAGGAAAPHVGANRVKVDAYRRTIAMMDNLLAHSADEYDSAFGIIDATAGAMINNYTPTIVADLADQVGLAGGREIGEKIRTNLNNIRAYTSFDEGGKQFTGTEKVMLDQFLANAKQQPETALLRLREARARAEQTLQGLEQTPDLSGAGGDAGGQGPADLIFDPATGTFTPGR